METSNLHMCYSIPLLPISSSLSPITNVYLSHVFVYSYVLFIYLNLGHPLGRRNVTLLLFIYKNHRGYCGFITFSMFFVVHKISAFLPYFIGFSSSSLFVKDIASSLAISSSPATFSLFSCLSISAKS